MKHWIVLIIVAVVSFYLGIHHPTLLAKIGIR